MTTDVPMFNEEGTEVTAQARVYTTVPAGTPDKRWARTDKYRFYLKQLPVGTVFNSHKMMEWSGDPIKTVYNTMQQLFGKGEIERVGPANSGNYATTASLRDPSGRIVKKPVPKVKVIKEKKPMIRQTVYESVGNVNGVTIVRDRDTHSVYALHEVNV